jgi:hypothetical protein
LINKKPHGFIEFEDYKSVKTIRKNKKPHGFIGLGTINPWGFLATYKIEKTPQVLH